MRRHKSQTTIINQINTVPYIDVMLVLLVIFMATSQLFSPSILNLPSISGAKQVTTQPVAISLMANNVFKVSQETRKYEFSNLNQAIAKINTLNLANGVVVEADKNIQYAQVIAVVDSLYSKGIHKVGLLVKNKP